MDNKFLLISGRPGSGKTDLMIYYANQFPETTLILSEESTKKQLQKKGLKETVLVVGKKKFTTMNVNKFDTVCIDYIELFDNDFIKNYIEPLKNADIRMIVIDQMRRDGSVHHNIFV